jgi:hypothetical protein
MQSKKRLPATWLDGDCMNIHISPSQEDQLAVLLERLRLAMDLKGDVVGFTYAYHSLLK